MTALALNGGLSLDSFNVVEEFVADYRAGRLVAEDRQVHGSHPLSVLVESTLEAVSRANLSLAIIGLSSRSEALLVEERRKLEDRDERVSLQQFLFSFEPLCAVVRDAGYGRSSEGDADRFFHDLIPEWLVRLVGWAESEQFAALAKRVTMARDAYVAIAGDIVAH
jgi:hypothetical protein